MAMVHYVILHFIRFIESINQTPSLGQLYIWLYHLSINISVTSSIQHVRINTDEASQHRADT